MTIEGASGGQVAGEEVAREQSQARSLSLAQDLSLMLRRHDAACATLLARVRPAQNASPIEAGPLGDDRYATANGDDAACRLHGHMTAVFALHCQSAMRFTRWPEATRVAKMSS